MRTYPEIAKVSGKSIIGLHSETITTEELIKMLMADPRVLGAEPNYIVYLDDPVAEPFVITKQPLDWTALLNTTAEFSVTVVGIEPITYQWQRSNDGGDTWKDINGANSADYSFTATDIDDGAVFRVVVSNIMGSVTSETAQLQVTTPIIPPLTEPRPEPDPGCNSAIAGSGMLMLLSSLLTCIFKKK